MKLVRMKLTMNPRAKVGTDTYTLKIFASPSGEVCPEMKQYNIGVKKGIDMRAFVGVLQAESKNMVDVGVAG